MALLRAVRTYSGSEGVVRRGDIFEVEDTSRADKLKSLNLAEDAPEGAEITNYQQRNAGLDDMSKTELETIAENEGVTYPDGALKADILAAIKKKRESDYYKAVQNDTAIYGNTADAGTVPAEPSEPDADPDATGSGNDGSGGA